MPSGGDWSTKHFDAFFEKCEVGHHPPTYQRTRGIPHTMLYAPRPMPLAPPRTRTVRPRRAAQAVRPRRRVQTARAGRPPNEDPDVLYVLCGGRAAAI